jgi:hypothetical protein
MGTYGIVVSPYPAVLSGLIWLIWRHPIWREIMGNPPNSMEVWADGRIIELKE